MKILCSLGFCALLSLTCLVFAADFPNKGTSMVPSDATQAMRKELKGLNDANPRSRLQAVELLSKTGTMKESDALVLLLKDRDNEVSSAAHNALWQIWGRTDNKAINSLYSRGTKEMAAGELQKSISTFTQIIRTRPDFAEAWNKRATLYFFTGELEKSLADCYEVIKRNPNHFGALAGYGQIYLQLGQPDQALRYLEKAYAINPTMQSVAEGIAAIRRAQEQSGARRT
jgi:tetratricopeptide (TPR) repeat protein